MNSIQRREEEKSSEFGGAVTAVSIHNNNNGNSNNKAVSSSSTSFTTSFPLKDNSNIQYVRVSTSGCQGETIYETSTAPLKFTTSQASSECQLVNAPHSQSQSQLSANQTTNSRLSESQKQVLNTESSAGVTVSTSVTTSSASSGGSSGSHLKCLETLAQKAGITFDEKYEVASTLLTLEKAQSPAQVAAAAQAPVPIQFSQEQLQQLHQLQLQQAFTTNAIQVKQEFPSQTQMAQAAAGGIGGEIKQQLVDHGQGQVQQMQVIDGTAPQSPHHTPNSTAMAQPQHSTTTISTMSPLQPDWSHGRLQVVSNPSYLNQIYPQLLMSMPGSIGQQPIQVITTGKPFQGGQIANQVLAHSKPMLTSATGNINGAYTIPAIPSSQPQTLFFSPLNVLSSQPQQQQPNLIPTMAAPAASQKTQTHQDVQKNLQGQKVLQKVG